MVLMMLINKNKGEAPK